MTIESTPVNLSELLTPWNSHLTQLITTGIRMGGFVAGGFARRVLAFTEFADAEHKHWWQRFRSPNIKDDLNYYLTSAPSGDIDIFFPTGFTDFVNFIHNRDDHEWIRSRRDGMLLDVLIDRVRLQLVNSPTEHVDDLLHRFDIANAAVAFDRTHVHVVSNWREMEASRQLHVQNWKSPLNTIHRLSRWYRRHDYKVLSMDTRAQLGTQVTYALEEIQKHLIENPRSSGIINLAPSDLQNDELSTSRSDVVHLIKEFIPTLPDEQLLLLTTVIPSHERFYQAQTPHQVLCERFGI